MGIITSSRGEFFDITEVIIEDDESGIELGKRKGKYLTLAYPSFCTHIEEEEVTSELAKELGNLIPDGEIMVVGAGNSKVITDSLGTKVADEILATRHLQDSMTESEEFLHNLRQVSVLTPGVMGVTGFQTAEIVKAMVEVAKPKAVIVIDSLCARDISRCASTIQMSNTGITPGSGTGNNRTAITEETLGVPVIAIGVPTVVYVEGMLMTVKDVDILVANVSSMISTALNLVLQPHLTYNDIVSLRH